MPKKPLEVLPQHTTYSIGKLSHELARAVDENRTLRGRVTTLEHAVRREFGRGVCSGSADALGRIFAGMPHFEAVRWVSACISKSQGKRTSFELDDELIEQIFDALYGEERVENMPKEFWLERAKKGVANGPSV